MSIEYCDNCESSYCDSCEITFECVICEKTFCESCAENNLDMDFKCEDCKKWKVKG